MITSNDIPLGSEPINRAAHHRTDQAWLEAALQRDDVLVFFLQGGDPLVAAGGGGLVWLGPEFRRIAPNAQPLFMGLDRNDTPVFGVQLDDGFSLEGSLLQGAGEVVPMRASISRLSALQANLASTARSILEWHASHRFCSKCGAESEAAEAGWKRVCPNCGAEHFPRTDPVAIMLAVKGDMCLIGRQATWPQGYWSCLAGFVEPGETFEQAAARELEEEAGIKCDPASAEYLFCQPWPFPSSMMIGLILEAETEDIIVDKTELETAKWISRDELRTVMAGEHPDIFCPMKEAVAHHILKAWADRD